MTTATTRVMQPPQSTIIQPQEIRSNIEQRVSVLALGLITSAAILITLQPPASIFLASVVVIATLAIALDSGDYTPTSGSSDTVYVVDTRPPRWYYPPFFNYIKSPRFRLPVDYGNPELVISRLTRREEREPVGYRTGSSQAAPVFIDLDPGFPPPIHKPINHGKPKPVTSPLPRRVVREPVGDRTGSSSKESYFSGASRDLPPLVGASTIAPSVSGRETVGSRGR